MLICINCGRSFENANYCMYCGTLLREKIVNYETSGTLLRSNLDPRSVSPIVSPAVNMDTHKDQKKTAVCVTAADSGGSVGGTVPDISIEPVSEQPEKTDNEPIEEDISFDDFMTKMDESAVSDETESSAPQAIDSSAEQEEIEEPQEIDVSEVEVETAEPVSEQPESSIGNSIVSQAPQSIDYSEIDSMFGEPPKVSYTVFNPENSVQSAKPMSWIERLKRKKAGNKK